MNSKSSPEEYGFSQDALNAAIAFANDNESTMNRDIAVALREGHFGEPWPVRKIVGPVKSRGGPNGVIIRHGNLVASWGDVERVDMTFSCSKSYLALIAGIAIDDGLISEIDQPVRELVKDGGFDSDQNRSITWAQMLQLTSEWEGTLWDKPDSVDHNRNLSARAGDAAGKGVKRNMQLPGTHWEYNDVRVNRLSLALMRVFGRPLPDVLKERIMDPIGASDTWQWHGYENSYVEIDGQSMQSVSGGGHWGGGLWINSLDHARVGQLMLNRGQWNGQQLISRAWIDQCLEPCPLNKGYGYLWWLNTARDKYPAASASSFFELGVGANIVWIDPDHDLVVVVRWIDNDSAAGFVERLTGAMIEPVDPGA